MSKKILNILLVIIFFVLISVLVFWYHSRRQQQKNYLAQSAYLQKFYSYLIIGSILDEEKIKALERDYVIDSQRDSLMTEIKLMPKNCEIDNFYGFSIYLDTNKIITYVGYYKP